MLIFQMLLLPFFACETLFALGLVTREEKVYIHVRLKTFRVFKLLFASWLCAMEERIVTFNVNQKTVKVCEALTAS